MQSPPYLKDAAEAVDTYFRDNIQTIARLPQEALNTWCEDNNLSPTDRRRVVAATSSRNLTDRFPMASSTLTPPASSGAAAAAVGQPVQKIGVYPTNCFELTIPNSLTVSSWSGIESRLRQHLFGTAPPAEQSQEQVNATTVALAAAAVTAGSIGLIMVFSRRKSIYEKMARSIVAAAG